MYRSPFDLEGRLALVTGSSRGIGLALARSLAEAGARVVLNGRDPGAVQAASAQLAEEGLVAVARPADVTDPAAVSALVDGIESGLGPLDVVVNNAGLQQRGPFLDFPLDGFDRLIDLNLRAPFVVAQAVGRSMAERGRGKIINIGSVQSKLGRPTISPYAATKGGLSILTKGLCADLGPLGIQVNCLAPGYFATELTSDLVDDPGFSAWVAERTPAGRWGELSELGGAIVFLASDASSFVNGQTIFVDGGMTAVV